MTDVVDSGAKTVLVHSNDGHGHHGHHGIEGKDAAFLAAHFTNNAIRDEGKDHRGDLRHLEDKMFLSRAAMADMESRMMQNVLKEMCELKERARDDHEKTRDLIRETENQRMRDENMLLKIKAACTTTVPCPT